MLVICKDHSNIFGDLKNRSSKTHIIDICTDFIKDTSRSLKSALDCVAKIYSSVIRYNEILSTSSSADILNDSHFFARASKIGNVFEDLFEKEIPRALNNIFSALSPDTNESPTNMGEIISNIQKIAISVSKTTNLYLNEG